MINATLVSGNNFPSNTITLPAGLYLGFIYFVPSYVVTGTTNFTNLSFSMTGTNVTNVFTFFDGNIPRQSMIFGNAPTYPSINLDHRLPIERKAEA